MIRYSVLVLVACCICLILVLTESAQAELNILGFEKGAFSGPINTDRPDFTESPMTIDPGRFQLESGYTYTYDDNNSLQSSNHVFPEVLLRAGINPKLEFRFSWLGWSFSHESSGNSSATKNGETDINVGFKLRLYSQEGSPFALSTITDMNIPSGSSDKTADDVEPAVKLLWSYNLCTFAQLAGNMNFSAPKANKNQKYFEPAASVSLGLDMTDRLGVYVEYFGFYPVNIDAVKTRHLLNGGFTYVLTDNLQFDIRAGFGLNSNAEDFFTGTGVSVRM